MANSTLDYNETLASVLRLAAIDRLRLAEALIGSVKGELVESQTPNVASSERTGHWGKELVALVESLDLSAWDALAIPDVGAWVHDQRKTSKEHRT